MDTETLELDAQGAARPAAPAARAQHGDLRDRDRDSRGSPGSGARSSRRRSSTPLAAASAFTLASQVPNLFSNLFSQAALSAAFVPVFTELLQEGRKREAFRLAATLFWIILIALGALTLLWTGVAGLVVPLFTGANIPAGAHRRPLARPVPGRPAAEPHRPAGGDPPGLRRVHDPGARARRSGTS